MSLRCIEGKYIGNSLYLNRNSIGETLGSDHADPRLTLALDCEGVEAVHMKVVFEKGTYLLVDCSAKEGVFVERRGVLECWCGVRDSKAQRDCDACVSASQFGATIMKQKEGATCASLTFKINSEVYQLSIEDYTPENPEIDEMILLTEMEAQNLTAEFRKLREANVTSIIALCRMSIQDLIQIGFSGEALSKVNTIVTENRHFSSDKMLKLCKNSQNIEKAIFMIGDIVEGKSSPQVEISRLDPGLKSCYLKRNKESQWLFKSSNSKDLRLFFKLQPRVSYEIEFGDSVMIGSETLQFQRFGVSMSQQIGTKKAMEDIMLINQFFKTRKTLGLDISLFSIFDGHNGRDCAQFISEKFEAQLSQSIDAVITTSIDEETHAINTLVRVFENCYTALDQQLFKTLPTKSLESGATALTVCIVGRYVLCANLGDSKAFISRNGCPFLLSRDLRPVN